MLGGTFDPVHYGHLCPALQVAEQLAFDELHFIPCAQPPHRHAPFYDFSTRLSLVETALAEIINTGFCTQAIKPVNPATKLVANPIEQRLWEQQGQVSYTANTLKALHQQWPAAELFWLIGADSLATLTQWHEWQRLFEFGHVVACNRPGYRLSVNAALQPYLIEPGQQFDRLAFKKSITSNNVEFDDITAKPFDSNT